MNIFIYTNSYDANSGGSVVMHRLCHIINEHSEHKAFIVKLDPFNFGKKTLRKYLSKIKWELINKFKFNTNKSWVTPVWNNINNFPVNSVVIYPEIINGNPLNISNVVRWLLHQPGFHTSIIEYGTRELYFKFNSAIKDFNKKGSHTSNNELKVIYYPIDIYYENKDCIRDIESCYLVRKGTDKLHVHSPDSINIDNLTHQQIAEIFRRSRKFISYDDYTAYSIFSVLCGCPSYVVPTEGQDINEWYPNEKDRYGLSFGFSENQIAWADKTKHKVYDHILAEHNESIERVKICLAEIDFYFNN